MRFLFRSLLTPLIAQLWYIAGLALIIALLVLVSFKQLAAPNPLAHEQYFTVEKGQNVGQVMTSLQQQGLMAPQGLRSQLARLYVRFHNSKVQAGTYLVPARASFLDILALLESGKTAVFSLTIPEGLTSKAIVAQLETADFLSGSIEAMPAEGSLLATTVFVHKDEARSAVITQLKGLLEQQLAQLWQQRRADLPYKTPHEAVIMASIIQKESALVDEQPLIAGVFVNRLSKNWRLQADSTLVYYESEQTGVLGRGLKQSELAAKHPYNSYLNHGLPPSPIAHVGLSALQAALNPAEHKYYYFVADGSGGHAFAATLDEHNRNVAQWRKIEKSSLEQQ